MGQKLLQGFGYVSVQQRLEWLQARLLLKARDNENAEDPSKSGTGSARDRDWEDLPCVQIDLGFVECQGNPSKGSLRSLDSPGRPGGRWGRCSASRRERAREVMLDRDIDEPEYEALLVAALAQAEDSG